MSLDIEVDIPEGRISGSVSHTFTPFSSACQRISFDSDRTTIHGVTLKGQALDFQLNGQTLWIDLDRDGIFPAVAFIKIDPKRLTVQLKI